MANTIVQNCQRGIVFISFLASLLYTIFTIINLIKKGIDPTNSEGELAQSKYQQGEEKPKKNTEESADKIDHPVDQAVIASSTIKEDDPVIIKIIKKMNEFMKQYFPLLIVVPLNILTGTSKAFSLVFYLFILGVVIVINVVKLPRKCFEHKCILVILENMWIIMLFFELLNIWTTTMTLQPYILISG